jgi:O86/O127-antigen biosynthesis beta-1,3-galactosyltransferase
MSTPVLSVLLPIGREDRFLEASLRSLAEQTYRGFDVHVLAPPELANYLKTQLSRTKLEEFTIVHSIRMANLAFALNYGIEKTTAPYIARMDGDDRCSAQRFEAQVRYLEANPSCCAVGLRTILIDENDNTSTQQRFPFYGTDAEIRSALRRRNAFCHPSVTFRRTALEAVGGYRYGNTAEDHELFFRLARRKEWTFANLSTPAFFYRRHNAQLTDWSRARAAFTDIAGFMTTELLRTHDIRYLAGILRHHPLVRKWGQYACRYWLRMRGNPVPVTQSVD